MKPLTKKQVAKADKDVDKILVYLANMMKDNIISRYSFIVATTDGRSVSDSNAKTHTYGKMLIGDIECSKQRVVERLNTIEEDEDDELIE